MGLGLGLVLELGLGLGLGLGFGFGLGLGLGFGLGCWGDEQRAVGSLGLGGNEARRLGDHLSKQVCDKVSK